MITMIPINNRCSNNIMITAATNNDVDDDTCDDDLMMIIPRINFILKVIRGVVISISIGILTVRDNVDFKYPY